MGLGFSFSPTLPKLLAEVKALAMAYDANLFLVHAGEPDKEGQQQLEKLLDEMQLKDCSKVIFEEGNVLNVLTALSEKEEIDLLVTGALKKETFFKYYSGSVARTLARKSGSPILLIPDPSNPPKPIKKVVISISENHPEKVLEVGIDYAQKAGAEKIYVVKEAAITTSEFTMKRYFSEQKSEELKAQMDAAEIGFIQKHLDEIPDLPANIEMKILQGHSGLALVQFTKEVEADLLIDSYPEFKLGIFDRIFPHDIEYTLLELPCKLLLIK
ncbi:MAG: universal stress protein [Bacteroidetes bacterium]|nr:universal stress protein [Bacteroidota bacterium]